MKDERLKQFHVNYSHNVGLVSSILFFPQGGMGTRLPPTLLERLKNPADKSTRNDFIDFFNQFFRVGLPV